jgi:hypothetical protein
VDEKIVPEPGDKRKRVNIDPANVNVSRFIFLRRGTWNLKLEHLDRLKK